MKSKQIISYLIIFLGSFPTIIGEIIYEYFVYNKICAQFVPRMLSENQRNSCIGHPLYGEEDKFPVLLAIRCGLTQQQSVSITEKD